MGFFSSGSIVSLFGKSETFIGIYDNAISKEECDILISQFEKSIHLEGKMFNKSGEYVVDYSCKKCIEISDQRLSRGDVISRIINESLRVGAGFK